MIYCRFDIIILKGSHSLSKICLGRDPQLLEFMVPIILTAVVLEVVLIPVISGSAANNMAVV